MAARAPFTHTSSTLDLTSPDALSPPRHFTTHHHHHQQQPTSSSWMTATSPPVNDKLHSEHHNGHSHPPANGGLHASYQPTHYQARTASKRDDTVHDGDSQLLSTPTPFYRSAQPPVPSRSPSPRPFSIPSFRTPTFDTLRFVSLCVLWYSTSAVSSNTGKVILNSFRFPVTLTIVQFFFVAAFCMLFSRPELGWTSKLRYPSHAILRGTLPMAAFQVGGHIFSSLAISRVPVSTVHTIKALSPLFTVLAYACLFGVSYSAPTYLSLLPLTAGVMLATSVDISLSNVFGLVCAFGSTLVFVSQNIFFKKIMPTNSETTSSGKLDKINLLFFSSSTAFALMIPLWIYSDATRIWAYTSPANSPSLGFYFFLNGTVHFAQNLLAFAILSSTSPVTYSIASLVKRIAVICLAIVWFKQTVHPIQAVGIVLTAVGLWMYNNAKRDVEKGEKKMRQVEAVRDGMLPISVNDQRILDGGGRLVHNSPKPNYSPGFASMSTTSAVKGFQIPSSTNQTRSAVRDASSSQTPSRPPVTLTSPPVAINYAGARQRRLSVDHPDSQLPSIPQFPPSLSKQTTTLLAA